MKKLIFALIVVAALLVVAMPVAAQGPVAPNYGAPYLPNPYLNLQNPAPWYNRTPEMNAQWAGDPFGGNAKLGVEVTYVPDGKGGVLQKVANAAWPYQGIVAKFGATPWSQYDALPGGIPSSMSGDASTPRKAAYIGGAWADASVNPANAYYGAYNGPVNLPTRASNEAPFELPACVTMKVPAATNKWFKLDTWKKEIQGQLSQKNSADTFAKVETQIWLDDELDGATKPSGSAVFGAASKYMLGTAPDDYWSKNTNIGANSQDKIEIQGFQLIVYGPETLAPNNAFAAPNAWILTLNTGSSGSVQRSCTAAAFAGQACVSSASGGNSAPAGNSLSGTNRNLSTELKPGPGEASNAAWYGTFNPAQPSHLSWFAGTFDGWAYARVYNQMIWDGTMTICSYRNIQQNPNNH